ncbi:MAG: class F sortase [Candidatus Saccharimonas sp.]|jgi:sortase (surface protein transpeptidase)
MPSVKSKKQGTPKRQKSMLVLLSLCSVALIGFGVYQLLARVYATKLAPVVPVVTQPSPAKPASPTVAQNVDKPSEVKPPVDFEKTYQVLVGQPRKIIIPSLGISGFVQKIGKLRDGTMAVPDNIHFGGWYTGSVSPGDEGLSIIDGHAGGTYEDGIFKHIDTLTVDAAVDIQMGDKSLRHFTVVAVKTVPEAAANELLFSKRSDIPAQLNLITCSGTFDRKHQTYDQRTVVWLKSI